jgi:hypothetical protein
MVKETCLVKESPDELDIGIRVVWVAIKRGRAPGRRAGINGGFHRFEAVFLCRWLRGPGD